MTNYTKFPNWLIDEAMPECSHAEWRILCLIARKTVGWGKDSARISINDFMVATKIKGRQHVVSAINSLVEKEYISRESDGQWFNYSIQSSNLELPVTLSNQLPKVTTSSNLELPDVVTLSNQFTPTLKKERKDKEREIDPVILLAGYFTELTALFPKNGSYVDEWELPLTVLFKNAGGLEPAKMKLQRAWEYARNPKGRDRPFTIKSPLSLSTIIANLPAGSDAPETTIKVRTR